VDLLRGAAMGGRHAMFQESGVSELPDQILAGLVGIVMVDLAETTARDESVKFPGQCMMTRLEEGPVEMITRRGRMNGRSSHGQLPSKAGFVLPAKASKARRKSPVAMQIACACASDSISSSMPMDHS